MKWTSNQIKKTLGVFILLSLPTAIYAWVQLKPQSFQTVFQTLPDTETRTGASKKLTELATPLKESLRLNLIKIQTMAIQGSLPNDQSWAYWAVLDLGTEKIKSVIQSEKNKNLPRVRAKFFETLLLNQVQKRFSKKELYQQKFLYYLIPKSIGTSQKSRYDWHVFIFPSSEETTTSKANLIAMNAHWPLEAFRANQDLFEKVTQRSYLLHSSGKILGHTRSSYVGGQLDPNLVEQIFRKSKKQNAFVETAQKSPLDQLEVDQSVHPLANYPLTLVTEVVGKTQFEAKSYRKSASLTALALLVIGAISFFALIWMSLKKKIAISSPSSVSLPRTPEAASGAEVAGIPVSIINDQLILGTPQTQTQTLPKLSDSSFSLPRQDEDAIQTTSHFEANAPRLHDPRLIASSLTQSVAALCESPTLFFRFNPRIQIAFLETHAGWNSEEALDEFSFPIHKGAIHRIFDCTRRGKLASLSHYEPLAQPILKKLGIAVFEAWAIPQMKSQSKVDLLGVLVILHSGVLSSSRRDLLVRMMRSMAIHHPMTRNELFTERSNPLS